MIAVIEFVRAGFKSQYAYRGVITDRLVSLLLSFVFLAALWGTLYASTPVIGGRTYSQMLLYIGLAMSITAWYIYPFIEYLSDDIRTGRIAIDLLLPLNFQLQFHLRHIGISGSMIMITMPVLLCCVLLSGAGPDRIAGFACTLMLGMLTQTSFSFLLGTICFWTESGVGVSYLRTTVVELLSGALIPLNLFGGSLGRFLVDQPFAAITYRPISILFGQQDQWLRLAAVQSIWILVMVFASWLLLRAAVRRLTINGG